MDHNQAGQTSDSQIILTRYATAFARPNTSAPIHYNIGPSIAISLFDKRCLFAGRPMLRNKRCALASYPLMGLLLCGCLQVCLGADEIDNASARAFNAAAALQNAGLHIRAAAKWSEFISSFPKDERIGRAHYYLGVCRLREKKFNDAIESFQTVLTRWPNLEQADKAQYNLAMARYEIADEADNKDAFRQAAKDFEQVVAKHSDSEFVDEALYYLADCLFNAGDVAAAIPAYEKLIAKHPNSPQAARAYYDLGIAQQQLEKLPEAAKTYRTFLEKQEYASHELAAEIRLRLAICLYAAGQLDQAAEQFAQASQISGFELASYAALRLGQTQLDQGKHDEAAGLLNAFAKKFPKSEYRADAAKTAGQCYYLADKPQDAVRVLAPVANSKDPPAAEAAYWLGRSQLKLGQADQALRHLKRRSVVSKVIRSPSTSRLPASTHCTSFPNAATKRPHCTRPFCVRTPTMRLHLKQPT